MSNPRTFYNCRLNRLIDADSASIVFDVGFYVSTTVTCRLNGLDSPERFTTEGKAATAFVAHWLERHPLFNVVVEKVPEKFGRWLVEIVSPDGASLNSAMLAAGHAKPYDGGKRT